MEVLWYNFFGEGSYFAAWILGIGLVTMLLRFMAFVYVLHIAKESSRMGRTKNRYLKSVKNAYDRELLRHEQVDNVSVFVWRRLPEMQFLGMSISFVDRLNVQGLLLGACVCFFGMVQGYYEEWQSETMGLLLLIALSSSVILLSFENLLKLDEIENLIEIRMIDYFENDLKCDVLMGERNLQKKERSLLLARQMEQHMANMEMAADRQDEQDQQERGETSDRWEQVEPFMQMLDEFFGS